MENRIVVYKCGHCSALGIVYQEDQDFDDLMYCNSCASQIEYGDYEADHYLNKDVVDELHNSLKDFKELRE